MLSNGDLYRHCLVGFLILFLLSKYRHWLYCSDSKDKTWATHNIRFCAPIMVITGEYTYPSATMDVSELMIITKIPGTEKCSRVLLDPSDVIRGVTLAS